MTVKVIKEPIISVSPYVRGTQVIPQDLTDEDLTLIVDQANYFAFKVDDIEKKQAHTDWEDMSTNSGAYALKDAFDTAVLSYMYSNVATANKYGTGGAPVDVGHEATDTATPLQVMNRLNRLLDEQNVPTDQRWFIAGPKFWEQMSDENSKIMDACFTGSGSTLKNGLVYDGLIRNFKCYLSNNLPTDTNQNVVLAGHMSSTATVSQIVKTEALRAQDSFADMVRGLHVYGRKVLRTNALAACVYSID